MQPPVLCHSCVVKVGGPLGVLPLSRLDSQETRTEVTILLSVFCCVHTPAAPANHVRFIQGHLGRLRAPLDRVRM